VVDLSLTIITHTYIRLFVYQACRGKRLDRGVPISHDGGGSSSDTAIMLPAEADFLYAYSTADGMYIAVFI